MTYKAEITAIILAGGESSRMGRDKALLPLGQSNLLSRTCLIARECAIAVYIVSPWSDKYRRLVPDGCRLIAERLVLGGQSNTPLIGFAQGLELVQTPWVLLLACDLPQLSSSQVKQWSQGLATVLPTEIALLPSNPKGWEALCGFYRRDCLAGLQAHIDAGGRSFQAWLQQYPVRELKLGDRFSLFNCNTPEDWQSLGFNL